MPIEPENGDIHEVAGGWITERKGTPIPGFLKLTYVGFSLFGGYYLFSYWMGETTHSTRGALVTQLNEAIGAPAGWWLILLAVVLGLFILGLWWFVFVAKEDEG